MCSCSAIHLNAFSVTRKLQIGLESDSIPEPLKAAPSSKYSAAVVFKMKLKIEPDAHIKGRASTKSRSRAYVD